MKGAQTEIRRQKTVLEQKKLEKVRALGLCVVRFVSLNPIIILISLIV